MVLIAHIFSRPQTTLLSRMIRFPRVLHFEFTVLYRLNIYRYLLEGGIYIIINLRGKSSINFVYAFSVMRGDSCPSLREIERVMNNLFQRHLCNYSFIDCLFHPAVTKKYANKIKLPWIIFITLFVIRISRPGFVFRWLVGWHFSHLKIFRWRWSKTYYKQNLIKGNFFVKNWRNTEIYSKLLRRIPDEEFSLIAADPYDLKVLNNEKYWKPKISFFFFSCFYRNQFITSWIFVCRAGVPS